jgi:hypothetical protein
MTCSRAPSLCRSGESAVAKISKDVSSMLDLGGQAHLGIGHTAMLGPIGVSQEFSFATGVDGSRMYCREVCVLVGLGFGGTADAGVTLGTGSPSNGWKVGLFGKLAAPIVGGGEFSPAVGSDGVSAQFSYSHGAMLGGGIKACGQSCEGGFKGYLRSLIYDKPQ